MPHEYLLPQLSVHEPQFHPPWQQFCATHASMPPLDEPEDELEVEPLPELEALPEEEEDEDVDEPEEPDEERPDDDPPDDELLAESFPPSCTVASPPPPSSPTVLGSSMPRTEAQPTANARAVARHRAVLRAAPRNAIVHRS